MTTQPPEGAPASPFPPVGAGGANPLPPVPQAPILPPPPAVAPPVPQAPVVPPPPAVALPVPQAPVVPTQPAVAPPVPQAPILPPPPAVGVPVQRTPLLPPPPPSAGPPIPPPPSSWPQSPAPTPPPFSFPSTSAVPQPPAQAPRGLPGTTAPAGAPQVPRLVLPSSGALPTSKPASTEAKRGLFGISWLGGRKATTRGDLDSPPPDGQLRDDDGPSTGIAAFFERASVLLVLGLFALIGVGAGVYLMFFRPDPVVIPPRVYSIPLATPTFQPLAVADATKFLAALPTADLNYGLRTAEPTAMRPVTVWPSRFAEEWLLTYDDGAAHTMTVQAVQHYTLEAATAAYQHLLAAATAEAQGAQPAGASPAPSSLPSASPKPSPSGTSGITVGTVSVGSVEVGKSFTVTKDVTESVPNPAGGDPTEVTQHVAVVTWQNGTGVFVMTADPAVIGDLFTEYGL